MTTTPEVPFDAELPEIMGRYSGRYMPMPLWRGPICEPCWLRAGRVLPAAGCACTRRPADVATPGGAR
jgi:hypothetical protein